MHVRVGECGYVLWGIGFLITFMIILTILFTFTLVKISCQYTENCWENRSNVQGKENSSAQYAVKIVLRRVYVQAPLCYVCAMMMLQGSVVLKQHPFLISGNGYKSWYVAFVRKLAGAC